MSLEFVNTCLNQGKHIWCEIESDNKGFPTKYRCIRCLNVYNIKSRDKQMREYMDKKNSILNRIAENKQKIKLFDLIQDVKEKDIIISHLTNENLKLNAFLTN